MNIRCCLAPTDLSARHLSKYATYAAVLTVVCFVSKASFAAQITFAFDATITDINATAGFAEELQFTPSVGQALSGTVTFTPVPFGQTSDTDARLEVSLAGETFVGQSYKLATINDYPVSPGFPFDALSVECGVSAGCVAASFQTTVRELSVVLRSSQNVVPGGQLMDSVDSWNSFDGRQLLLFLSNVDDTKRMSIFAAVGAMRAIPEPVSAALLSFAVFLIGMHRTIRAVRR